MTTLISSLPACVRQSNVKAVSFLVRWIVERANSSDILQENYWRGHFQAILLASSLRSTATIRPSKAEGTLWMHTLKQIKKKLMVCLWTGLAACMFIFTTLCFLPVFCFVLLLSLFNSANLTCCHTHSRWQGNIQTFPFKVISGKWGI